MRFSVSTHVQINCKAVPEELKESPKTNRNGSVWETLSFALKLVFARSTPTKNNGIGCLRLIMKRQTLLSRVQVSDPRESPPMDSQDHTIHKKQSIQRQQCSLGTIYSEEIPPRMTSRIQACHITGKKNATQHTEKWLQNSCSMWRCSRKFPPRQKLMNCIVSGAILSSSVREKWTENRSVAHSVAHSVKTVAVLRV